MSKHEIGGDDDQNIIKDADSSINYFETNADGFITKFLPAIGYEKIKTKFDHMYHRISSDKAREWTREKYEESVEGLKKNRKKK